MELKSDVPLLMYNKYLLCIVRCAMIPICLLYTTITERTYIAFVCIWNQSRLSSTDRRGRYEVVT